MRHALAQDLLAHCAGQGMHKRVGAQAFAPPGALIEWATVPAVRGQRGPRQRFQRNRFAADIGRYWPIGANGLVSQFE